MPDLTANKIKGILSERHPPDRWAFWTEVKNAQKKKGYRQIDAFAISKAEGNPFCIAYEIKTSVSDFYAELSDNLKRSFFVENSNEFFFVAPPGVIKTSELPEGTGLIEVGDSFHIKHRAPQRIIHTLPVAFVASLMNKEDSRNIQQFPLFKLAGKELTERDLEKYIQEGRERFRLSMVEKLKKEVDKKYKANLPEKHKRALLQLKEYIRLTQDLVEKL